MEQSQGVLAIAHSHQSCHPKMRMAPETDMTGMVHARGRDKARRPLGESIDVPRAEIESRLKGQRELLAQIRSSVKREMLRRLEAVGEVRNSEDRQQWESICPTPDGLEWLEGCSDSGSESGVWNLQQAKERLGRAGVDLGALFRERLPDGGHKLVQSIKGLEARLCPHKAGAEMTEPLRAADPVVQEESGIHEVIQPCVRGRAHTHAVSHTRTEPGSSAAPVGASRVHCSAAHIIPTRPLCNGS
jgi:hypothetical protein